MVETVLGALAPIVVTLLLGFVAAWRHDFEPTEATVLNRMVMLYAVPIALFVGTIGTARAELVKDVAFAVTIFVAVVGLYGLVLLLFRFVLRFSLAAFLVCVIPENDFGALRSAHIGGLSSKGGWGRIWALAGGNLSSAGTLRPHQAGTQANIRLMFQAMVTRLHSPRAPARPRSKN